MNEHETEREPNVDMPQADHRPNEEMLPLESAASVNEQPAEEQPAEEQLTEEPFVEEQPTETAMAEEIATVEGPDQAPTVSVDSAPVTAAPVAPVPASAHTARFWVAIVVLAAALALTVGLLIGVTMVQPWQNGSSSVTTATTIAKARESVAIIEVDLPLGSGIGTGVIITSDGYIATNHHVIEGALAIHVYFTDGTVAEAELIGSSEMDDLAVLKVNKKGLRPATFDTTGCYVGQHVYAIGHPGSTQLSWTTTEGIVSFVDREMAIYDDYGELKKRMILLQVDAMLNPGNSGGPIINEQGEVVGIVSMRVEEMADIEPGNNGDVLYTGLGFALPARGAWQIIEAIMRDGNADGVTSEISFRRAVAGILCRTVTDSDQAPVSGVYITEVIAGSAADGQLMVGDIVTEAGGYEVTDVERLKNIIYSYYPYEKMDITLYRDGECLKITLTLGEADEE